MEDRTSPGGPPLDDAGRETTRLADEAKRQGKSMLSRQKDTAAEQVESIASALRHGARDLESGEHGEIGGLADSAADRLESFSRRLREKDVDALVADAEDVARRSPAAFFAGSVVAGFLLARFLKSSAERRAAASRGEHRPSAGAVQTREAPAPLPAAGHTPSPVAPASTQETSAPQPQRERAALLVGTPAPTGGSHAPR